MGPMTGRAAGYCAGYPVAGYTNPVGGRGYGFGFGFGRGGRGRGGWGRRNWCYGAAEPYSPTWSGYGVAVPYANPPAAPSKEQQVDALKGQAEFFEEQLAGIRKRIEELEAKKK
jgi:hypothetical protein